MPNILSYVNMKRFIFISFMIFLINACKEYKNENPQSWDKISWHEVTDDCDFRTYEDNCQEAILNAKSDTFSKYLLYDFQVGLNNTQFDSIAADLEKKGMIEIDFHNNYYLKVPSFNYPSRIDKFKIMPRFLNDSLVQIRLICDKFAAHKEFNQYIELLIDKYGEPLFTCNGKYGTSLSENVQWDTITTYSRRLFWIDKGLVVKATGIFKTFWYKNGGGNMEYHFILEYTYLPAASVFENQKIEKEIQKEKQKKRRKEYEENKRRRIKDSLTNLRDNIRF